MADDDENGSTGGSSQRSNREAYLEVLGLLKEDYSEGRIIRASGKRRMALNRAHEIRKFEIGLLWQRALFFWGFQLAIFAALGGILDFQAALIEQTSRNIDGGVQSILFFALASLGLLTSLGMVKIYEGSKFWQENWEFHIDMLEDEFEGALHKSLMSTQKEPKFFSVSKLGKITAKVLVAFWSLASIVSFGWSMVFFGCFNQDTAIAIASFVIVPLIVLGTLFFAFRTWYCTYGSAAVPKKVYLKQRKTTFKNYETSES